MTTQFVGEQKNKVLVNFLTTPDLDHVRDVFCAIVLLHDEVAHKDDVCISL